MRKFTAVIVKEEGWYVAHCIELGVARRQIDRRGQAYSKRPSSYIGSSEEEDVPESSGGRSSILSRLVGGPGFVVWE